MINLLYADGTVPAQPAAPSPLVSMFPLLVIFVIFYFLLIRPQQKKVKLHKKMVENLKKGDRVLTSSGFYGVVVGMGDTSLDMKLAENVKVRVLKSAISDVLGNSEESSTVPQPSENGKSLKV